MKKVSYPKASLYYLMGNLFNKGIGFITVPIFTRALSTSDYGIVNTYSSWVSILTMVICLAIYMGIRAAFIDYPDRIDDVVSACDTFTIVNGIGITVVVCVVIAVLPVSVSIVLAALCCVQALGAALTENYSMYLMMNFSYKQRTLLLILPNLLYVCLAITSVLLFVKSDLYMGLIVPHAAVVLFFGILTAVFVFKRSRPSFNKKYLKYTLALSVPLVAHGMALNVLSQSDRTMITWLADSSQTGIYSLIYNISMLATVIISSIEGVWIPFFVDRCKKDEHDVINRSVKKYILLISCAMIGLLTVSPEIIKLLADQRYWEGIIIIPPIIASNYIMFAYSLYVNIEHYHKKTKIIAVNTIIAAAVNVVLNFMFIPYFGYVAAAYTTLASYFVSFCCHARYAKKLEARLYPIVYFIPSLLQLSGAIFVFYLFLEMPLVRWGVLICYLGVLAYMERETIKKMVLPAMTKVFKRKQN